MLLGFYYELNDKRDLLDKKMAYKVTMNHTSGVHILEATLSDVS